MVGTSHTHTEIPGVIRAQSCSRTITEVILHHTWAPRAAQYQGERTVEGIYNYHHFDLGWSDIGYHYLIAPDGTIWLGRALGRDGAHVLNHNRGTVGVSMILNGDVELPSAAQVRGTAATLTALLTRFNLTPAKNFGPHSGFHRDYSSKTCPGTRITKAMVLGWLAGPAPVDGDEAEPDEEPDVSPWAEESVAWAKARGLMTGYPDGTFRGRQSVTREELAVVVRRVAAQRSDGTAEPL